MSPLGAFALALSLQANAPEVEVRPSTSNVSVGERFQVTVEIRGDTHARYEFPKQVTSAAVELTESRAASTSPTIAIYDAQVFGIGREGTIPEIEVRYRTADGSEGTIKSSPVPLNVVSTLNPNEQDPQPADFAPPQPVLVSRAFWVASGLAGVLLIAFIALLVRRFRFPKKPAEPVFTPAITPEEDALAGLDRLARDHATLAPKSFYIQLVQILKQYFERRLEAPVLEMTSTETMAFVKNHSWTEPHASAIRELVSSADMVKFGGANDASQGPRQIQVVRDLVARLDRLRRAQVASAARELDGRKTA